MRFAICNETFQDWEFDRAFSYARQLGYEGIEIAPFTIAHDVRDISAQQRRDVRRLAEEVGLEVVGLHWLYAKTEGFCLTSPDPEVRANTADYLVELARLCRDLGGKILVLGSPQQRRVAEGMDRQVAQEHAAEVLRRALPALEETQTTVAIEPLAPSECNFLQTAHEARELMGRVGSSQVRLHLDVKAMSSEATPVEQLIRTHADAMVHFHANDPNLRGPGMGQVDFVPILQALQDVGYQGWVSVEVFDYQPGIEALASQSIDCLKRCLAEISS